MITNKKNLREPTVETVQRLPVLKLISRRWRRLDDYCRQVLRYQPKARADKLFGWPNKTKS